MSKHTPEPWRIFSCVNACAIIEDVEMLRELEYELADARRECEWKYDENEYSYETECGHKWQFISGDLAHNGYKFCMYCGGGVKAQLRLD